jgi:outer membrane protein OmpA-like peptidoglycan-associated protein
MVSGESMESVDRLKALLFDDETRALSELAERLEALAKSEGDRRAVIVAEIDELAERAERDRADLAARIEALNARLGTPEVLRSSVASVLDGALVDAEASRHDEMSQAMAPLVVRTIKSEIRNSQDEMVEALYPITGRMVSAYVASAMRDLMAQVNSSLDQNWLMLRLKSLSTGRSPAELALASSQRLAVEDVYLIRRFSGELVGHWPKPVGGDRDQVLSGVLSAITEFTTEAFKAEGSSLRQVDLGPSRLYLRASPTYLLAVRTHGFAPGAVERVIDEEFLGTLEQNRDRLMQDTSKTTPWMPPANGSRGAETGNTEILSDLYARLGTRIDDTERRLLAPPFGLTPLRLLAVFVGLPLLAWVLWYAVGVVETQRVANAAREVIAADGSLKGYPLRIAVTGRGSTLAVHGLVPSDIAKADLAKGLAARLPAVHLEDETTPVATAPDATPAIAEVRREVAALGAESQRIAIRRALDRAVRRLEQTRPDLAGLKAAASGGSAASIAGATRTLDETIRDLKAERARLEAPITDKARVESTGALIEVAHRLANVGAAIGGLIGDGKPAVAVPLKQSGDIADSAEDVAAEAERLAAITITAASTYSLSQRPAPVVEKPAPADPRAVLERWCRNNAVFFADSADYRDPARAKATIEELAGLLRNTNAVVRVIGYVDERGAQQRNASLAQERADKVAADLRAAGAPATRVAAVGRKTPLDISPEVGTASPNRRVEFELGFIGETPGP